MKVLLLGYSSIARRRVLPALRSLGEESVDIASQSASNVEWSGPVPPRVFRDYEEALSQTDAKVAYISTVNSCHARWTRKALEAGLHVAVDKPAFLSLEETGELTELAARKRLCLAEAIVYYYHPRFEAALNAFREADVRPTHLFAAFSMPPLAPRDFRYNASLGGGALWDLGVYALTPGRLFFDQAPLILEAWRLSTNDQVDTGFSVAAIYPGGRSSVGSFGYTTGYINRLDIVGPELVVTMDRAFSPPANVALDLTVRHLDQTKTLASPPADSFALFFQDFFAAIERRTCDSFASRLLADAQALHRLRTSALTRDARTGAG